MSISPRWSLLNMDIPSKQWHSQRGAKPWVFYGSRPNSVSGNFPVSAGDCRGRWNQCKGEASAWQVPVGSYKRLTILRKKTQGIFKGNKRDSAEGWSVHPFVDTRYCLKHNSSEREGSPSGETFEELQKNWDMFRGQSDSAHQKASQRWTNVMQCWVQLWANQV